MVNFFLERKEEEEKKKKKKMLKAATESLKGVAGGGIKRTSEETRPVRP